jgi:cobalt/nickel transport system permease protein
VAAGLGGYAGINASALCTAVEFGIQPMLYVDASGVPLYCPYPLSISVPAMMAGHLTVAGLAELILTVGVVRLLQRSDPAMLATPAMHSGAGRRPAGAWAGVRLPALALAAVLMLSPLGILAAGTAWGEWAAEDFAEPHARAQITAASLNQPPPPRAPEGLARMASLWTAPIAHYAPPWIRSEALGYLLSAMFGAGLVILVCVSISWTTGRLRGRRIDAGAP